MIRKNIIFIVTTYLQGCSIMTMVKDLRIENFTIVNITETQEVYSCQKVIVLVDSITHLKKIDSYLLAYKTATRLYIAPNSLKPYIYGRYLNNSLDCPSLKKGIRDFSLNRLDYEKPYNPLNLTQREMQVMECLYNGYGPKETSKILSISYKTVDAHMQNIYKKTGLHNLSALNCFVRSIMDEN